MKKIDSHTHTYFSFDGRMELKDLVKQASEADYAYLAITEHLDCDYLYCEDTAHIKQLNLASYQKAFNAARDAAQNGLYLAFGIEAGFCPHASGHYQDIFAKTDFDVIINSVHSLDGLDIYRAVNEAGRYASRGKRNLYLRYLQLVLESVKADYLYHIVGHIGYITRYMDFSFDDLNNFDALMLTEEILKEIIARGKTLEINAKGPSGTFLPGRATLERYYQLGGRDITFGSDAHHLAGLGANYEAVIKELSAIGFDRWTIYIKGKKQFINFT